MISVITCTNRDYMRENVFQNYTNQVLKNKELIIILNKDDMDVNKWKEKARKYKNVTIYHLPEKLSVGECKNFAVQQSNYRYIAKFDDDDYYAPLYLESAWLAFRKNKQIDLIGKSSIYYYFKKRKVLGLFQTQAENKFVSWVADSTLVFKKEVFNKVRFTNMKAGSDKKFQMDCKKKGFNIFSTDRYNHAAIRRENPNHHTWKIKDQDLLRTCTNIVHTKDFKSIVT
ncbi:glycosyltransferase family 2 protein, partial [Salibacterium salarium]